MFLYNKLLFVRSMHVSFFVSQHVWLKKAIYSTYNHIYVMDVFTYCIVRQAEMSKIFWSTISERIKTVWWEWTGPGRKFGDFVTPVMYALRCGGGAFYSYPRRQYVHCTEYSAPPLSHINSCRPQGADTPHPPKEQRRQVEIIWTSTNTPLLPNGIGELNLCQAAHLRRCELFL